MISDNWSVAFTIFVLMVVLVACHTNGKMDSRMASSAKMKTGEYLTKVHRVGNDSLNYRILYPNGFDETKTYPLLNFLHGSCERGDNNNAQLVHGGGLIRN